MIVPAWLSPLVNVFLGILRTIRQIHAFYVDGVAGGVVELQPVVTLELLIHVDAVLCTHLVDTYGCQPLCGFLCIGDRGETGNK